MRAASFHKRGLMGISLIEIAVSVAIIGILASLLLPVYSAHVARSEGVRCTANLRNLYVAASAYLQAGASWPQIPSGLAASAPKDYAHQWVDALSPFGAPHPVWICPSQQRAMKQTMDSIETAGKYRIDYIASPFDDNPTSPHRWSHYPWFFEQASWHGHGNLILFNDGTVMGA